MSGWRVSNARLLSIKTPEYAPDEYDTWIVIGSAEAMTGSKTSEAAKAASADTFILTLLVSPIGAHCVPIELLSDAMGWDAFPIWSEIDPMRLRCCSQRQSCL